MVHWAHKFIPKQHLDQFIRFCRAHHCVQHTDIQTTKRKTCVEGGNRQYLILLLFYIENSLHLAYFPVNFRKQTVSFSVDIRIPLWEFLQRTLLDCDLVIQIPYIDKVMVIGLLQPLACLYFFNSTRIAKI